MGVDREDFSDAANWQTPQELPDLRRVGIVALDTETNDEGLRADRGSAWPWRGGISAASALPIAPTVTFARIYFPLRHPDSENFDPEQVFRWLQDLVASDVRYRHPERSLRLGLAARRWRHHDAALRSARGDRRAGNHRRREPFIATASTHCVPGAASRARMRPC